MAFVNMLDVVHPIGSVLETNSLISPSETIGGTWEEIVSMKSNAIEVSSTWIMSSEGMIEESPGVPPNSVFVLRKGNLVMITGWLAMGHFDLTDGNKRIPIMTDLPRVDNFIGGKYNLPHYALVRGNLEDEEYNIQLGFDSNQKLYDPWKTICLFGGFRGTSWASNYYNLRLQFAYVTSELPKDTSKLGIHAWKRIG